MVQLSKNIHWIKRVILDRLGVGSDAGRAISHEPKKIAIGMGRADLSTEEMSKAELDRLQKLIEDRKRIARETDISYHLWGFYKSHFRSTGLHSLEQLIQEGEWYDVKILHASTANGLNKYEFELKGASYRFVDDEENQGWADKTKLFSVFLYDDSDRCLIEIPMKVKIDKWGSNYSIMSNGPNAFLPGGWVNDFINVKLKQQHIRNQEIREQKHQERLWEIEDLKDRFGISD
jgi:hypothetical protein